MDLLIGTTDGLFHSTSSGSPFGAPVAATELTGRRIEHLSQVGDTIYVGTDDGLFASRGPEARGSAPASRATRCGISPRPRPIPERCSR